MKRIVIAIAAAQSPATLSEFASFADVESSNRVYATNAVITASQDNEKMVSVTLSFEALSGSPWFFKAFGNPYVEVISE